MGTNDMIVAECSARLSIENKEALLDEVSARIATALDLPKARVQGLVKKRESISSTGLQYGVALPHCAIPEAESFTVGVITLLQPVPFGAIDGIDSDIIFFVAGPEAQRTEHVRLMAALTSKLRASNTRDSIRAITDTDDLKSMLANELLPTDRQPVDQYTMLLVYVQDPDHFTEVVESISTEPEASITVSTVQTAGAVLNRLPLFATFWNESENQDVKRIEIIIPRNRANWAIRQIEELASGSSGFQVSAIELSHGSGTLEL